MGKKIKLNIKNEQLAEALNLGGLKEKLAKRTEIKKEIPDAEKPAPKTTAAKKPAAPALPAKRPALAPKAKAKPVPVKAEPVKESEPQVEKEAIKVPEAPPVEEAPKVRARSKSAFTYDAKNEINKRAALAAANGESEAAIHAAKKVKLGPTGRHIDDLFKKPKETPAAEKEPAKQDKNERAAEKTAKPAVAAVDESADDSDKRNKSAKVKEYKDFKPRRDQPRSFDSRDRQGLRDTEDDQRWRKRRAPKQKKFVNEELTIRPTSLSVRVPISIKDLAAEMKLKAGELIATLLSHGVIHTLNDFLDDETTLQLIGHDLGCELSIDSTEEERIRITDKTIKQEISEISPEKLVIRPPIVAFMGHVDHGKTSLIDSIRKSNRVSGEAGAITQHIGAFRCHTAVGDISILDTPGHEAFSSMRARGADVTDIVVLVVAGDEGIKLQTLEAIQHAKTAGVTIVVALNKCDRPNFNADNVYRQLAEHDLLPEAWGGSTITVNTSATTGEGVSKLLEMLALQAEVLELKASPTSRARGTVVESEMHKGLGMVATILVQNGTLRRGDALVCDCHWGRVRTMHDEYGKDLREAKPSTPVEITGLSGLPEAGEEFIVVGSEKEAKEIAEARSQGARQNQLQRRKTTLETMLQDAGTEKKVLNVILRADVQGSLEAVKAALQKIHSTKAELLITASGVGEVSESDVQLAAASKAVIIGFHTQIESNAADMAKEFGVTIRTHDVIYHAIDDAKVLMAGLLDKLPKETDMGTAEVKAIFKSSQYGLIAGCMVTDGYIKRNNHIRVVRDGAVVATSPILSIKRVKEDVKEVQKGVECGILLTKFKDLKEGDILQAFEITYIAQEL